MARKKQPKVVEPVTRGVAADTIDGNVDIPLFNDRFPDVVRLDTLLASNPPVKGPVIQTGINISQPPGQGPIMVQTGIDIITRNPIFKPVTVVEDPYKTADRKPYAALEYFTGSYNTRPIKALAGGVVYLNDTEYDQFKSYFKEAPNA